MSKLQRMIGFVLRRMTRRRARGRQLNEITRLLEASRGVVAGRFTAAKDSAGNREAINHIIGIERWGQSRLQVFTGAPMRYDSYRDYRLPQGSSMDVLRATFTETRNGTIALAGELAVTEENSQATVKHNDLGELTAAEWLVYLDDHARRESLRLRR